jgi:hypothetical protein
VCRRCPVVEACLWSALLEEHELAYRHRYGVRGGLLPAARIRLARTLGRGELEARYHQAAAAHDVHQNQSGAA